MKIKLHIGTHKTGTTSIQRFARKHGKTLRSRGLWYPNYNIIQKGKHYAHHSVAHAIAERGDRKLELDDVREFLKKLKEDADEDNEGIFLSAEPFYRHTYPESEKELTCETYWEAKENYIKRVADTFKEFDVQIILVLRRQDEFSISLYKENIKVTGYNRKFDRFLTEKQYYFDYLKHVELWEKYFPELKILVFENLLNNAGLIVNFFDALGLDVRDIAEDIKDQNVSLPDELTEFKRLMNTYLKDDRLRKDLQKNLEKLALKKKDCFSREKHLFIKRTKLRNFLKNYKKQNRILGERYLDRKDLFENYSISKYPEFAGLNDERVAEISSLTRMV